MGVTARTKPSRRAFIAGAMAAPLAGARAVAGDAASIPIADMHAHLFFVGPRPASLQPMGPLMAGGRMALVSWSLVGDMPWLKQTPLGLKQSGAAARGAATDWFKAEVGRVKQHAAGQGLRIALAPADLDKAAEGQPHVLLSVEGASFLDDGIDGLNLAYEHGVRHLQLVHYVRNRIGDFQTEKPELGGLSDLGKEVVAACNRLGILVDLAHCTPEAVRQALAISTRPMVWSHSSIASSGRPHWKLTPWRARQLSLDDAKALAAKGGVVGLWALKSDVGSSIESYGERLLKIADWLGDEHAGFGTDLNALSGSPIRSYADLRRVVEYFQRRGVDPASIRRLAFENYLRILRASMDGRQV